MARNPETEKNPGAMSRAAKREGSTFSAENNKDKDGQTARLAKIFRRQRSKR